MKVSKKQANHDGKKGQYYIPSNSQQYEFKPVRDMPDVTEFLNAVQKEWNTHRGGRLNHDNIFDYQSIEQVANNFLSLLPKIDDKHFTVNQGNLTMKYFNHHWTLSFSDGEEVFNEVSWRYTGDKTTHIH